MISLNVALLLINNGILSLFVERDDDYSDEIERWVEFDDGEINVKEVADLIIQNLPASNLYEMTDNKIIIDYNYRRISIDIIIEYDVGAEIGIKEIYDVFQAKVTFI